MTNQEVFNIVNEVFYNSKNIVPNSSKSRSTIEFIIECFKKVGLSYPPKLATLEMNLEEVDRCIDVIADVLCDEGFEKDGEPNEYGLELEDAIDFLLHFRYVFVDGIELLRMKKR